MSAQLHPAEGYTLLEMLVVLGLLGLILSITVPWSFQGMQSRKLNEQGRMIITMLKTARTEAIVKNKESVVEADLTRNLISIREGGEQHALDKKLTLKMLTARQEAVGEKGAIRFFANGSSTGGMVILQGGGRSVEVHVDWLTGKISRGP